MYAIYAIYAQDLWEAWKHNKKDCFIMLLTLVLTFVFDTAVGLAAGIGTSVLFYLGDLAFASFTAPVAFYADHGSGIEEVILQGDLTFIQCSRFQNFMDSLYRTDPGTHTLPSSIPTPKPPHTSSPADIIPSLNTPTVLSTLLLSHFFSTHIHLCQQPSPMPALTPPRKHFL